MSAAVKLREDVSASELRALARATLGIRHGMNFRRQSASTSAHTTIWVAFFKVAAE